MIRVLGITEIKLPTAKTISEYTFKQCTNLVTVDLNLIKLIFHCLNDSVPMVESITIGTESFKDCTKLDKINFPNLISLGKGCFENTGLTKVE